MALRLLCALLASMVLTATPLPRIPSLRSLLLTKDNAVTTDNKASFADRVSQHQYISRAFNVTTEDGYILTMFRLRSVRCNSIFKPRPILLMAGILQSSDAWPDPGPGVSLAYLLADDCHDLWLGNYRGNTHGRAHVTLNPDKDAAFWDYNIEHISYYDFPAQIDFVLSYSGSDQLTYIGFSQGGGAFMGTCALRPEYNNKVKLFIALAPSSRVAVVQSAFFRYLIYFGSFVHRNFPHQGNWQELYRSGTSVAALTQNVCEFSTVSRDALSVCEGYLGLLDSPHPGSLTKETQARLHAHFPAGASAKLLDHYAQLLNVSSYRRYDHGRRKNLLLYGQAEAPDLDLTKVTVPTVVFYGLSDGIVSVGTVKWLLKQLPNIVGVEENSDKQWNHVDMFYSKHFKESVYDTMRKYLEKY